MSWTDAHKKRLESGLEKLGIVLPEKASGKLALLAGELLLWNPTHGLIGASGQEDPAESVLLHILDSLAPLDIFLAESPVSLGDVGSGAGFPGLPLALLMPDTSVALIEKMGRRCDFLRNAVAVLGLKNRVRIIQEPLEKVRETFSIVTMRAFSPIPRVLPELFRITLPGGAVFAYKGRMDVIREELGTVFPWESRQLTVPFLNAERHLVILRKDSTVRPSRG